MSTNYYIIPFEATKANFSLDWVHQVHIAQFAAGAFLLQAVRGDKEFNDDDRENMVHSHKVSTYYSPVENFPSIENWSTMKSVILDLNYAVIDEYGTIVHKDDFIHRVENNQRGHDARYHDTSDWIAEHFPNNYTRSDWLDAEGYSFELAEFS